MINADQRKEEIKLSEVIQISLAAARVNAKMTQEDVAKRMKIGKRTIINWEKGTSVPSFSDMNMLSQIYDIPVDNIFLPKNRITIIITMEIKTDKIFA